MYVSSFGIESCAIICLFFASGTSFTDTRVIPENGRQKVLHSLCNKNVFLGTSASLLVTSALLVGTRSY